MDHSWAHRVGRTITAGGLAGSILAAGFATTTVAASSCVSTGAVDRDGTPLTAKVVNPPGTVSGKVNATGCSVGIYFDHGTGKVRGAEVFGASYFGVLADGNGHTVAVDVTDSRIHDIGDTPISSLRHGEAIAYRGFSGTATGTVRGNRIWSFQEAGINFTGPGTTAAARENRVIGRGVQGVLAQNGVQVIFGAHGTVVGNVISDLEFTGPNTGSGVLVAGGPSYGQPYTRDARIEANLITSADVGIAVFELDPDWNPPVDPTNVLIAHNVITNGALRNVAGWDGESVGYQAGISVDSNGDRIIGNVIVGRGYDQASCGDAAVCFPIDTDVSIGLTVKGNVIR